MPVLTWLAGISKASKFVHTGDAIVSDQAATRLICDTSAPWKCRIKCLSIDARRTIRNQDLTVPFEGFENGLTGRQRGRALAGCTPGAASFLRAERPGVYMWILRPAHTAL